MGKKVTRLFEQFQPDHYQLHIIPDRDKMTFKGIVTIHGKKTGRPSQRITFHQKELTITSAQILKHVKGVDEKIEVSRINHQKSFDEVRIHSESMIYPGDYSVNLEFSGKITDPMNGIYPCYFKHEGKDKKLIATQFESHHAREAFPSIDEPEAKATFDLALTVPKGEVALSNCPVRTVLDEGDTEIHMFNTTPKMSTYLLAFVYGEMHGVTGKSKDGTLVRSWATIAQPTSYLQYANDEAIKCLEFFTDFFQTPFPLPKFDQVALPDFEALAMENWGLVTFREVGLLADPKNRSISGEQLITLVIAHELSHQWFGNLVTMKWWDDLWLNESFASIMENIAPDRLHPDWEQWEDFATGRVLSCSHRDIYKDVQSVKVEVKHPDEISTLFDPAIVYAKGARLINMLHDFIGEEAFREGLKQYFKKHEYGNTSSTDLWKALSDASKLDVAKLMDPWIKQSGAPLVRVKRVGKNLELSQQRFLLDGEDKITQWPIPLLSNVNLEPAIFEGKTLTVPYAGKETPIFNIHGNGHYIVSYEDPEIQKGLQKHIIDRSVDAISRINLLNDMLLLSRAGEFSLVDMLEIIRLCGEEPRDAVWSMFARIVGQAQSLTDGNEAVEVQLRAYRRELTKYWYEKLGWEDKPSDDPNTKHLRSTMLSLSIAGENKDAIETALKMFAEAGSVEKLPAEQRAMIAGVAVRFGKPANIDQLLKEYESSHSPDVQQSIAAALCSTRDEVVAKKLINWGLIKGGKVRKQDVDHWFAYLMRNYRTRELAWDWLTGNWEYLLEFFGGGKHMEYFIWYSSGPLSTPEWLKKFSTFYEPKLNEPASKRNIQIALGEIAARVEWRQREEARLKAFFDKLS